MHASDRVDRAPRTAFTRRAWLATAAVAWAGAWRRADEPPAPQENAKAKAKAKEGDAPGSKPRDDAQLVEEVEALARKAGLGPFKSSRKGHYLGIGDAAEAFRTKALQLCERLAGDYQDHFRFKGFALSPLPETLVVVTLGTPESFEKFSGMPADPALGGYYDRETNRLVVLDNRAQASANLEVAKQANLVSLVHEATHQLTYNSGLLSPEGDVPVCISEGLATYAETWEPTGNARLGRDNRGRKQGLTLAKREHLDWIPLTTLLTDDTIFDSKPDDPRLQLAYGESWLLVHHVMNSPSWSKPFRSYLRTIAPRKDSSKRLDDARAALGDLDLLEKDIRRAALWTARPVRR